MNLTDYRDITALLQRHGFRFSKSMGQNFLTAAWVPQQIAAESGITAADGALEIGPGVGCLTAELAKAAGRVTAVELDERLRDVLGETLADFDNVSVVFADALKADLPGHLRRNARRKTVEGVRQSAVQRDDAAHHRLSRGGLF